MRFHRLVIAAVLSTGLSSLVQADIISDGSLSVDIDNSGQFNLVTLNGTPIDTSSFLQQQYTSAVGGIAPVAPVAAVGSTATYAGTSGSFNVAVTSRILGPLASIPATTNVLQQVFTYVNTSTTAARLTSVSDIDQDLNNTGDGDVVDFDSARQATFAIEAGQLMAAIASTNTVGATFGYDIGLLGSEEIDFPMDNPAGPFGPSDTAMSLGYDFGLVPAGESRTVEFRYLLSTNLTAVPADFAIPEPATLATLTAAVGLLGRRRRHG